MYAVFPPVWIWLAASIRLLGGLQCHSRYSSSFGFCYVDLFFTHSFIKRSNTFPTLFARVITLSLLHFAFVPFLCIVFFLFLTIVLVCFLLCTCCSFILERYFLFLCRPLWRFHLGFYLVLGFCYFLALFCVVNLFSCYWFWFVISHSISLLIRALFLARHIIFGSFFCSVYRIFYSFIGSSFYTPVWKLSYYPVVMSFSPPILVFWTFLQHALRYQFETWYIHSVDGTACRVWVSSQFIYFTSQCKPISFFAIMSSWNKINPLNLWRVASMYTWQ